MKNNFLSRKEQITLSVIEIIDQLGINKLSIRELAKKENVTEAALYRHFKSKNDIIIEVLRYYSKFDAKIINTTKKNGLNSKDTIIFFTKALSEYYESYPEITAIYVFIPSLVYNEEIGKEAVKIIVNRYNFLKNTIEEGKKNGELKSHINSESLTDIIVGSFTEAILRWRLENFKYSLKERIMNNINMILSCSCFNI